MKRLAALGMACCILVSVTQARADLLDDRFSRMTTLGRVDEPDYRIPLAKRIVVYTLTLGGIAGIGASVYFQIDASGKARRQEDYLAAHGGKTDLFCAGEQHWSAACLDYGTLRHARDDAFTHSMLSVALGTMALTTAFLATLFWPDSKISASPTLGGMQIGGRF